MRRVLMLLLAIAALGALPQQPAAQTTPFAPVAVVNGAVITGYDLDQRVRLIQLFARSTDNAQELQRAALDQLIEDRLKLQAGQKMGIEASEALVASALETFARTRNTTVEELRAAAQRAGVSALALNDLVAADAVWLEVVRSRFLGRAEPSTAEVDAAVGQGGGAVSYQLQEIGLPVREGRADEAEALARRLHAELAAGGDFAAAVRRHSRAPSAAKEGNVGWVTTAQLPPELAQSLATMQPGQVSQPIRVPAGWSIVKLLDRRTGATPAAASPSPDQRERARARIIDQRLGQLAEGYLQELRRDALIEVR